MKHIRLFEAVDEPLYQEIDENTFYENVETTIKLNDKEMEKLKSLFDSKEIWIPSLDKNDDSGLGPYTWIQRSTYEYFYSNFELAIYKCDDDWYYVDWSRKSEKSMGEYVKIVSVDTYYKCDQWDGLLSLIKDKLGKYSGSGYDMDREYRAYKFKG